MVGVGSVVTKDIPSWTVAAGNPCRVLREITDRDIGFYFKDRKPDEEAMADIRRMWSENAGETSYPFRG